MLPPQPALDCVELTVSDGSESRTFTNVAVGAVWLAGGQSNMAQELRNNWAVAFCFPNDPDAVNRP